MTDNTNTADEADPLMIAGWPVSPVLLEERPLRRCQLEECQSYCCNGGVWIHTRQVADILAHQELIKPHLPPERRDPSLWFDGEEELDIDWPAAGNATGTAVVADPTHPAGTTCIFLKPDRLCALQAAGIAAGEHPWRFKPFYCALHPLGLDGGQLVLVEGSEVYVAGGDCSRPAADGTLIPVYALFDVETKLVLGEDGFAALEAQAKRLTSA
jgi:hypothetical protein